MENFDAEAMRRYLDQQEVEEYIEKISRYPALGWARS